MKEMVMAIKMETSLRGGLYLTMVAVVSWVVSSVLHLSDGIGAFTIYIGFDEASPPPGCTIGRYGRVTVLAVVKF